MSTSKTLQEQIIQKAWEDSEFKNQLIANPKGVLKDAFDIQIPDSIELNILEETSDRFYLVLPQNPKFISPNKSEGAAWQ